MKIRRKILQSFLLKQINVEKRLITPKPIWMNAKFLTLSILELKKLRNSQLSLKELAMNSKNLNRMIMKMQTLTPKLELENLLMR